MAFSKTSLILFTVSYFLYGNVLAQSIRINEIQASNSTFLDEEGDTPDWIELYNYGIETISLEGFTLSDDNDEPQKWTISNTELQPGEYLVIWASDKDKPSGTYRTLVNQGDVFSYLVPNSNLQSDWTNLNFDDSDWRTGASGFGYGDGDDATILPVGTRSVFIRKTFNVSDISLIDQLFLDIDYDDGFAAYLNGEEIATANLSGREYNANTNGDREATMYRNEAPRRYQLNDAIDFLTTGENVFCVQVHNVNSNSSDLTIIPFLSALYSADNADGTTPPSLLNLDRLNAHTNFKISSSGEEISLYNGNGTLLDRVVATQIPLNISLGVSANQSDSLVFFELPTPGYANDQLEYQGVTSSIVKYSHESGTLPAGTAVSISGASSDENIFYTTDGSLPTTNDELYLAPIIINSNSTLRARIFKDDYLPSRTESRTYFVDFPHELPVVSLVVDPHDLYDEEEGIYSFGDSYSPQEPYYGANFWQDREKQVSVSFLTDKGELAYNFEGGVKVFGGWSRSHEQKSLSLFARKQYGHDLIEYPLFDSRSYDRFKSVILRNSGNDWLRSNFRDIFISSLMEGSGLDIQGYQPVATYLNGEYWGMYNLREKVNEHYLAAKHNIDANDIDLVEFDGYAKSGSDQEYQELLTYFENNSLTNTDNYNYVADKIDIENFIMYCVAQIYIDNRDWPGNNIRYWKTDNRKWQWLLYDLDFGFGIWGDNSYLYNTLEFALESDGPAWPNPPWSTLLLRKLMPNLEFRNSFVNRFADEMNSRFIPTRVTAHFDEVRTEVSSEISRHFTRWEGDLVGRNSELSRIRNFANNRQPEVKRHILQTLNLPAYHQLNLKINNSEKGEVLINDRLAIKQDQWQGDYFQSVPFKLTAIAKEGYRFSHWSGDLSTSAETLSIDLLSPISITANFQLESTSTHELKNNQISCYPNPLKDELTISFSESFSGQIKVRLYDQLGTEMKVLYNSPTGLTSKIKTDLSELTDGIYFLEIISNDKTLLYKKLIKV